jgi:uncharacterized protein
MSKLTGSLRSFRIALLVGWMLLLAAGVVYARLKNIPVWVAGPVIAAFLLEFPFYLAPGFESVRERLRKRLNPVRLGLFLTVSALGPYLIYSLGSGQFRPEALAALTGIALAVSGWYLVLRPGPVADVLFLALLAALMLAKVFDKIYPPPIPGLEIKILGQLMLIRVAATVMLLQRGIAASGFGFVPTAREWRIGVLHFLYFLPIGFPLAWAMGLIRADFQTLLPWKIVGTFLAFLWVVALSEEFVFRGLLQEWMTQWIRRPQVALFVVSALFGLVHLSYRFFPNWKQAAIAAVLGLACGRAYREANSIRAAAVTHALVVTVWRAVLA